LFWLWYLKKGKEGGGRGGVDGVLVDVGGAWSQEGGVKLLQGGQVLSGEKREDLLGISWLLGRLKWGRKGESYRQQVPRVQREKGGKKKKGNL